MVYMMIGLPASGKSTWVRDHLPNGAIVICPDEIRKRVFGVTFKAKLEPEVWAYVARSMRCYLGMGCSVIIDSTNITRKRRKIMLDVAKEYGVPVTGYYLQTPLEVCLQRNLQRGNKVPQPMIRKIDRHFQQPDLSEGFDKIINIG